MRQAYFNLKIRPFIILIIVVLKLASGDAAAQKSLDLIIWAGQSNAQGWAGNAAEYPQNEMGMDQDILLNWTFYGQESSDGKWVKMQAQKGRYPKGHFGPEVSFSREMKKAGYKPAVFKYCLGGTGLARDWKPPGAGGIYDHMVSDLNRAIKTLHEKKIHINTVAFVWIQGETDAGNVLSAEAYQENLLQLINHLRHDVLNRPDLKIVLGVDEQHKFVAERPIVVEAQKNIADQDAHIMYTSMYGLPKADATHLTPAGLDEHGKRIYDAFENLIDAEKISITASKQHPGSSNLILTDLTCEHVNNPLGIDEALPRLSWKIKSTKRGERQTAYRILVSSSKENLERNSGDFWDSGTIISDQSNFVTYNGKPLNSGDECFWKVMVWDKDGRPSSWSRSAHWSMGYLQPEDWIAQWISIAEESTSPYYRKTFSVNEFPGKAIVTIASLGYFELYLNGKRVGDEVLAPAVSNFDKRTYYRTYDLSQLIKAGENQVGVWMGTGWYTMGLPGVTHHSPGFRLQLEISGEKENQIIVSDATWETKPSSRKRLGKWAWGNFGGEVIDANQIDSNWWHSKKSKQGWNPAIEMKVANVTCSAQPCPGNIAFDTLAPKSIEHLDEETILVDFGTNLTGLIDIVFHHLDPGQKISMHYADLDGRDEEERWRVNMGWKNFATYKQWDEFISAGEEEERFTNKFNYHAFRYVLIEGLSYIPKKTDLNAICIETGVEEIGHFACSNDLYNSIHEMVRWTYRCLNLGGQTVDCPHRERLGYGDGQTIMDLGLYNFDAVSLYSKWSQNWWDEQGPDGFVPFTAPCPHSTGGGPAWGAMCIMVPWKNYQFSGDIKLLKDGYPYMKKYLNYLDSHCENDILQDIFPGEKWPNLGDWVPPRRGMDKQDWVDDSSRRLFNNCYRVYLLQIMQDVAALLNRPEDESAFEQTMNEARQEIHKKWFNPKDSTYANGEQPYLIFPLKTGITPEHLKEAVFQKYVETLLETDQGHLNTGMIGTQIMTDYLVETGRNDLVDVFVNKKTYPGWGYMIEKGATTCWEQWNGYYSQIHSCFPYIGGWFYKGLAGIQSDPKDPGFKQVILKPALVESVDWVECSYESPYGEIQSNWKVDGSRFDWQITVPPNSHATVYMPGNNIHEDGNNIQQSAHILFLHYEGNYSILQVEPGTYNLSSSLTFEAAYQHADLPDAMTFLDGSRVKTKSDWEKRKNEIKALWCDYYTGYSPAQTPVLLSADIIETTEKADGSTRKRIELTFDTPNKRSFEIEVWEPKNTDDSPRPLFLTQPREYQWQWAEEAIKRGYIACIYPGLDTHHQEKDYPGYQNKWKDFKDEYPHADWSSSLAIQAWLASRTLDYLLNPFQGYHIDTATVAIAGHSRYGKQSIYAAAFDERFKAVIARSSGTPTGCSYRFASRQTFMESVADYPALWAKASLQGYLGRENELPIEGNALMAIIAPRHLMIHTAHNDGSDPTFGVERNYLNAKKAYQFLDAADHIYLSYRSGQHNPITEAHTKHMFDFFDYAFRRGTKTKADFPESLYHHFDFQTWKTKQRKNDLKLSKRASIEEKIKWMLGEEPENLSGTSEFHLKTEAELGVPKWSRDRWNPGGLKRVPFAFGQNMNGNIYFDPNVQKYKGTVIWLHPWNYSHGSNEGYGVQGTTIYWRLAQEGYIVVGYDQFAFGDQLTAAFGFYEKYPHWSLLGRAVTDVSRVIDYLIDGKGIAADKVPAADPSKIYICGFSYGGMVGLYAAALDKRITGVASFSGFTPMRTDTDEKSTGGIRRLWEWHHVLPKLGLYHKKESEISYDYEDVISLISPRRVLLYSPLRDRFSDPGDIANCVEKAGKAWADKSRFSFKNPNDICRFQKEQQDVLIHWLKQIQQ